jgi:hypothetical protein
MLTCQQCRIEIDAAPRRTSQSAQVEAHIAACEACRRFRTERVRLQSLLGELEPVGAPPDFEFRLRARMAAQSPAALRFNWLRLTPRALGLAFAACLVCAFALTLHWHAQQPAGRDVASPTQNVAQIVQPTINQSGQSNNANVVITDQPAAVPAIAATIKTSTHKPRRAPFVREQIAHLDNRAAAGGASDVNDLSLRAARGLNVTSGGNAISAAQPIPVPVSASAKPLQVMLKDTQGVARLVNIEPVSFGSRDLLGTRAPVARIVNADSKGVW